MNKVLIVASLVEFATGIALVIVPSLAGRLLLGVPSRGSLSRWRGWRALPLWRSRLPAGPAHPVPDC